VTAMHEISPLANWQERFDAAADVSLQLRLRELPFLSQVLLRLDAQQPVAAAIQGALGLELPLHFGIYTRSGGLDACWLGPDEWLLVAPGGAAGGLVENVTRAAASAHHLVLDISANRTCIELRGTDARYVLAKGCHENTAKPNFSGCRVVQTLLAKVPVILQLQADEPVFRIFVRNSFAEYLARWLVDAAGEIRSARHHRLDALQAYFIAAR
jgi:sarcosine oxidase, subunit gamma